MAEPKTRPTDASVPEFFAEQPEARRRECERLAAMMAAATNQPAQMWGTSIVGFGAYVVGSGPKAYEWPVIAFSPRKNDLTVYFMSGFDGEADALAVLGRHKVAKACLYLKRLADVDDAVLVGMIERSVAAMAPQRVR